MSIHKDDFLNNRKIGCKTTNNIVGLDIFRRSLEKDFYADVKISNYGLNKEDANLSIEIKCNFTLSESLFFLQNPIPLSTYTPKLDSKKTSLFLKAYSELRENNTITLDISELNIVLTDTTILISKIYEQSIYNQLENIATELCQHSIYYTKGLTDTPYEIFIPVFEEDDMEPGADSKHNPNPTSDNTTPTNDYFVFWGVYYDRTDQAAIYDLQSKKIIHGDIQIFN